MCLLILRPICLISVDDLQMCTVVMLLTASSVVFAQPQNPPVRWEVAAGGNGHLYHAIFCSQDSSRVSWVQADSASNALGDWHLATIASAEENTFVYSLVNGNPAFWNFDSPSANSEGPWLGGISSSNTANDWQWVTGESWAYTNWAPLEPLSNGDALGLFGFQASMGPG